MSEYLNQTISISVETLNKWFKLKEYDNEMNGSEDNIGLKLRQDLIDQKFTDFGIIADPHSCRVGSHSVRVHRLVLQLNGCKCFGNSCCVIVNVSDIQSIVQLIDHFYSDKSLTITDHNFKDMLELAQKLGNENLLIKCIAFTEPLFQNSLKPNDGIPSNDDSEDMDGDIDITGIDNEITIQVMESDRDSINFIENNQLVVINGENWKQISGDNNGSVVSIIPLCETSEIEKKKMISFDYEIYGYFECSVTDESLKSKPVINIWNSCFVPISTCNGTVFATCGDTVVKFFMIENDEVSTYGEFHSNKDEFIHSIVVYTLEMTRSDRKNDSFLGIAIGVDHSVYLCKEPNLGIFYEQLHGYEDAVNSMVFDKRRPDWLFTAEIQNQIIIWKLGQLYEQSGKICNYTSVAIYRYQTEVLLTTICYDFNEDCLIACGEMDYLLFFKDISTMKPIVGKTTSIGRSIAHISGLTLIENSNLLAIRSSFSDELIVTDYKLIIELLKDKTNRMKFRQKEKFDYSKPTLVAFNKYCALKHPKPAEDFTYIYMKSKSGILGCGDTYGNIHLYDCSKIVSKECLTASKVLEWPEEVEETKDCILSVNISDDLRYLIGTTRNNLALVWKLNE